MAQWLNWGDGHSGSPNSISGTINTYATCTGTAGQTSLTTALSASAGDQILIHQSQGTGAGTWEICKVVSDAGATLNLATALANSYSTGAQAVLIPQYTGGNISGAVTGTAWNGSVGGIIALMSNGDLTLSGSINANYIGFRGGVSITGGAIAYAGEGQLGASISSNTANGTGGGGGNGAGTVSSGGGGGYVNTPDRGGSKHGYSGGYGGYSPVGNSELTNLQLGGGGGGGAAPNTSTYWGQVSNGSGIVLIFSKNFTLTGTISTNGETAKSTVVEDGVWPGSTGGGAAGSVLIKTQIAALGTNKITANGGSAGSQGSGGSVGRIRCDYFTSVSGSTTPTLSSAQDLTLNVAGGSNFFAFF